MPNLEELNYKLPVAPLAIATLDCARRLTNDIDKHLVETRKREPDMWSERKRMWRKWPT